MSDDNVKTAEDKATELKTEPVVEEKTEPAAEEKSGEKAEPVVEKKAKPAAEEKPVEKAEPVVEKKAKPAAEEKPVEKAEPVVEEKAKPVVKEKKAKASVKKAKADKKDDKVGDGESAEAVDPVEEPKVEEPKPVVPSKPQVAAPPAGSQFRATGRRKKSVARVFLTPGNGEITINKRPIENYFFRGIWRYMVAQPMLLTGTRDLFNVNVNVSGGGQTGQAGAVKHGISRALTEFNIDLRAALKSAGFLTRDARAVERKKYGLAGARKRYQFSKR
jgi:small subunit ribosomal protein S9